MTKTNLTDADIDETTKMIMDGMIECLNTYAEQMERGEHPMMSGPEALRTVAGYCNKALIGMFG